MEFPFNQPARREAQPKHPTIYRLPSTELLNEIPVRSAFDEQELKNSLPSAEFPIVQSYVDICLTGCLQIQQGFPEAGNFAAEFIQSTQEWSTFWENDRANPRRPFAIPMAQDIDVLLKKYLPTFFAEIRLAPGRW